MCNSAIHAIHGVKIGAVQRRQPVIKKLNSTGKKKTVIYRTAFAELTVHQ